MKKFVFLVLTLILVITLATPNALALNTIKTLKANYGVQIFYNSQLLSSAQQPFIVDGTTYVPLRMLMEAFGDKQISWDDSTKRVIINSGISQVESMYIQQLISRNAQITSLENEVRILKDQVASYKAEENKPDLEKLEDDLNDDYGDYNDFDITITVRGDSEDITLRVSLDTSDWNSLSNSKKESLMQKMCNDIWDIVKDADIVGYVKDGSTTLTKFTVKADKEVVIADLDIDELEDYINDRYWDYESLDIEYTLVGDQDEVILTVDLPENDWDDLTNSQKEDLLDDICDDIWDKAEDADVIVKIKDGSTTLKTIYLDPNENVDL